MLYNGNSKDNYHIGDVEITEDLTVLGDLKVDGTIDGTLEFSDLKTKNIIAEDADGVSIYDEAKANLLANFDTTEIKLFGVAVSSADDITGVVSLDAGTVKTNTIIGSTATALSIGATTSTAVNIGASAVPTNVSGDLNMGAGKTVFSSKLDVNGALSIGNAQATSIIIGRFPTTTTINGSCIIGEAGAGNTLSNNNIIMTQAGANISSDNITTNTINEKTATAGVTIDGVLLKDSQISTDTITAKTATNFQLCPDTATSVDIGYIGCPTNIIDTLQVNSIAERTLDAGINIDNIYVKDNSVDAGTIGFNINIGNDRAGKVSLGKAGVETDVLGDLYANDLVALSASGLTLYNLNKVSPITNFGTTEIKLYDNIALSSAGNITGVGTIIASILRSNLIVSNSASTLTIAPDTTTDIKMGYTGCPVTINDILQTDKINEKTSTVGVTVDTQTLIKDGSVASYFSGTPTIGLANGCQPCFVAKGQGPCGIAYLMRSLATPLEGALVLSDAGDCYIQTYNNGVFVANVMKFSNGGNVTVDHLGSTLYVNTGGIDTKGNTQLNIGLTAAGSIKIGTGTIPTIMEGKVRMYDIESQSSGDQSINIGVGDATSIQIGRTAITTSVNGTCSIPTVLSVSGDFQYTSARMEAYYDGSDVVSIPVINVYYPVVITSMTVSHQAGFSMDTTTTIGAFTYTGTRPRYVHAGCVFSCGMNSGTNQQLNFAIHDVTTGATLVPGSEVEVFIGNNASDRANGAIHFFPLMSPNKRYRLYVKNTAVNDAIIYHLNFFAVANPGLA